MENIKSKSLQEWNKVTMNTTEQSRDFLFDNYKVLLIFLVVVGHFVGPSTGKNEFLRVLKWFIVSFHMPAFIFISGYFSKKALSPKALIQKLLIPYIVYEIIYYLLYTCIIHKETALSLLKPKFTLWYILALFMWRGITPYFKKIPYYMILAITAGLLIGCSDIENNLLTIPRALVFYPYFVAGTCLERETLSRFRSFKGKLIAAVCVIVIAVFLATIALQKQLPMQVFYGRYNYSSMRQTIPEGLFWRIVSYVIGFVMTCAVAILMTEKKLCCSYIGKRTMAIYLFHGLTYSYLRYCTTLLNGIHSFGGTLLLLIFCAALTALFSLPPFSAFTNAVSNVPLPKFQTSANHKT